MKVLFLLLIIPVGVFAQTPPNPLSSGTKTGYIFIRDNVLQAAEQVPEENYSFKPAPTVRSFGQIIGHIADAQYEYCGPVAGGAKSADVEKNKTFKVEIIRGLKDAFGYCDKVYESMTDAKAAEMVSLFGQKVSKLTVLEFNSGHIAEHYGNIVTYMRIIGLTPPSSQ